MEYAISDPVMMEGGDSEVEEEEEVEKEAPNFVFGAASVAKLGELLHKLNSAEIKLCADAAKEFIKLLKGDSGGDLLRLYVNMSSNFSELLAAWKLREGTPGMSYVMSLISAILSHPDGKYMPNEKERISVSRSLDKFARSIIEERLETVCKELTGKEGKRQKAALLLMASVVRRGSGLASEVAKNFNFKLQGFSRLADYKQNRDDKKRKHSTRKAFVGFAMSFLEVGKPGLLRWVIQQKDMYSGVLRGLANDDDDTVTYILSTLRDRVLNEQSIVPPGLRSVLFGSITLEQLVGISGRDNGGLVAELAYSVLVMVCTDPSNGLMPDLKRHPSPLRGNRTRLLGLMKKLKATEISYHRDLLLAIVNGRPSLGSAYLMEFPYNVEDYSSSNWFASVCLAANLVSSVSSGTSFNFLDTKTDPPSIDAVDVRNIVNCISPRPFSRSVINKGLLHSDFLVKSGTLRLLSETLSFTDSFFRAIDDSFSRRERKQEWFFFKQEILNEARTLLPDPQVLLTVLSSLSSHPRTNESFLKRNADKERLPEREVKRAKKLKAVAMDDDTDMIIGGLNLAPDHNFLGDSENDMDTQRSDELDTGKDLMDVIAELWGLEPCSVPLTTIKDIEIFFQSKLLDALRVYLLRMPNMLEASFDFFVNLLGNPSESPINLLYSLLSLLVEYVRESPRTGAIRYPALMYKHLQPFINLLIFSPISEIKAQAYSLAWAAMSSTGAFDRNLQEIVAWLLFLPGCDMMRSPVEVRTVEVLQGMSPVIISFLCDAVSTVGNNLFRYWDLLRNYTCHFNESKDVSPNFSPLVICILQKCIRLLNSESGNFSLPEKSMISLYVGNTLKYLLQTQVDAGLLSALIKLILCEGLCDHCSLADDSANILCEWRPLKNLLVFAESILRHQSCSFFSDHQNAVPSDGSFTRMLGEVRKIIESGHCSEKAGTAKAFSSALIFTTSDELLQNFPLVMTICHHLRVPVSFLSSIIFLDQSFLAGVAKLWPEVFFPGLEMADSLVNAEGTKNDAFAEEEMVNMAFESSESVAATAFSLFLRQSPFHMIFPAIVNTDIAHLLVSSKIKDLLLAKISNCTSDCIISYLRLSLSWFCWIRSSYKIQLSSEVEKLSELEKLAELCYVFVKEVLARLLAVESDSGCLTNSVSTLNIKEVAETIFFHPVVTSSLACPLSCNEDAVVEQNLGESLNALLTFSQQRVYKIDQLVLNILARAFKCLFSAFSGEQFIPECNNETKKQLFMVFSAFLQRLYGKVKEEFDLCIRTEELLPLLPPFYVLHALVQFMSPFRLLELVNWIFQRITTTGLARQKSSTLSVVLIGTYIAGDAFKVLSTYLQQHTRSRSPFCAFWEMEEKTFDVDLIEQIYIQVCEFAANFDLDFAYTSLVNAVKAVYRQKYTQDNILHALSMVLARAVVKTPMEILHHCVQKTSPVRAKLLFFLVQTSPLHLSVFGKLFLETLKKGYNFNSKMVGESSGLGLSDKAFMMLLPAALSYLDLVSRKLKKLYHKQLSFIRSFYSKILLNGFRQWQSFASGSLFQEDYEESLPSSFEEFVNLVEGSLLGKATRMFWHHVIPSGDLKLEERLELLNTFLSCSAEQNKLLDCKVGEFEQCSPVESMNLVNRVVAKISFCRMLLFPKGCKALYVPEQANWNLNETFSEMVSNEEGRFRMQFLEILVGTWQCIVMKFPSGSFGFEQEKSSGGLQIHRFLELFILRTILELTGEMRDDLLQLKSIPFIDQLLKSSLLSRFGDPSTFEILRNILTLLSGGKFQCTLCQLLLAHSQFAPTIHSVTELSSSQTGVFCRPLSSILRSLNFPSPKGQSNLQMTKSYFSELEILKLLRILLHFATHQSSCDSGEVNSINLKDLHFLLLSSYSATLSEIDLEKYNLMHDIKCIDKSISEELAEWDYLWGSAALKIRKERALELDTSSGIINETETDEELRRSQFRECLPIDPKMCAATVLYFPYDRSACVQEGIADIGNMQRYDPVFILRFSIHALSMGYLEPMEFAGLGLLAVAFISISSLDEEVRKLGYESLGRYKSAIEKFQKKKNIMRLRLLLTYIQNGVTDPWQKIPSIIALFAAESSFILLDPSHDHYATLSKHLMRSSGVNMKCIPLFHTLFKSNSINSRTERLWMLRLAYAGLNSNEDAQIFRNNSTIETLLSFYSSPLSDNESKELILQIVRKWAKLPQLDHYQVERCGLFPWLSSLLSSSSWVLNENEKHFFSKQLVVVTEVVTLLLSSRNISEWLRKSALEQLVELTSHLFRLLRGSVKLEGEVSTSANCILEIIKSTLKMSQEREMNQPHFTLSFEGLLQIWRAFNGSEIARSGPFAELRLKTILMSAPPIEIFQASRENLLSFLMWAVATAMQSDSRQILQRKESNISVRGISEEPPSKESLVSKLLRWLVSSVILGKLFQKLNDANTKFSRRSISENLESLMEYVEHECRESNKSSSDCEEVLAATIFYLQQLLGSDCSLLPSVVSALCLLLHLDSSKYSDSMLGDGPPVGSPWLKIRCPAEAHPAWKWSFDKAWEDVVSCEEPSDAQKMEEHHACQSLMVIISNVLGKKPLESQILLYRDVEKSGVFEWERSSIVEIE